MRNMQKRYDKRSNKTREGAFAVKQDINFVLWSRTQASGMARGLDQREVNIRSTSAVSNARGWSEHIVAAIHVLFCAKIALQYTLQNTILPQPKQIIVILTPCRVHTSSHNFYQIPLFLFVLFTLNYSPRELFIFQIKIPNSQN